MVWFGVANDYKHLLVVFWIWVIDDWRLCVIFNYVVSILTRTSLQREHWTRLISKYVISTNQLHLVPYKNYFPSGMRLDVFLLNIFALIVKQPMRIPGPSDTSHIDLKLWLWFRRWLNNNILRFGQFLNHAVMLFLNLYELVRISCILLLVW